MIQGTFKMVWYKLKFATIKTKTLKPLVFSLASKPFHNLSLLQLFMLLKGRGFFMPFF